MVKQTLIFFLFISFCVSIFSFINDDKKENVKKKVIKTIIVDAGHGIMANGGHNGAKGAYSYEDDICLAVSKELVKKFQQVRWVITAIPKACCKNFAWQKSLS